MYRRHKKEGKHLEIVILHFKIADALPVLKQEKFNS